VPAANFPNPEINRPTSAALFVRYFRHIPVTGLNVFSVSVAIGVFVDVEGSWVVVCLEVDDDEEEEEG
jgi:hypothetical protein